MSLQDYRHLGNAASTIQRAILQGAVTHAYILEGDHNTDKAGFARAFAKALLCQHSPGEGCDQCLTCRKIDSGNYEDLYVISPEAGSRSKTLSIRDQVAEELQNRLKLRPSAGPRNIAIIEGADLMTVRAQNRFLKTLEEPAEGTVIMMLSENVENLLPTIRSRCITLRLGGMEKSAKTEMDRFAEEILDRVGRKDFFHDICVDLDKAIKGTQEAGAFLDALESAMSIRMRKGGTSMSRAAIAEGISLVEQTRMAVRRNVNQKYAIRSLILKLEEY